MATDWNEIALIEIDILESLKQRSKTGRLDEAFERRYSDVVSKLDRLMRW